MTAVRQVHLTCDGTDGDEPCPEAWRSGADTVAMARQDAKRAGWVYRGGKDLCPACDEERKELR